LCVCLIVCGDLETSEERPGPDLGCNATKKNRKSTRKLKKITLTENTLNVVCYRLLYHNIVSYIVSDHQQSVGRILAWLKERRKERKKERKGRKCMSCAL